MTPLSALWLTVEQLSASSAHALFVGLSLLCLAEGFRVVFEDDVGHGLLTLFEGGRVFSCDLPFREGLAVDACGHHPSAVDVAEADVIDRASVGEG